MVNASRFSEQGRIWQKLDKADGKIDGVVQQSTVQNLNEADQALIKKLSPEDQNLIQNVKEGTLATVSLGFSEGHDNDITILSATRMGENAVTWLSPTLISNWPKGETIDQAIENVAKKSNVTKFANHHPAVFSSRTDHEISGEHHSLVFANSDYNVNGDIHDRGDLAEVKQEGRNLQKAYLDHDYKNNLYENLGASQIINKISEKIESVKPGDELVIHYTGHGNDEGIAGVHNSILGNISPVFNEVLNSELQEQLKKARDKGIKVVMILDSCESGYTTDYVRDYQVKGLDKTVDDLAGKNISSSDKTLLNETKENNKQIKQLFAEVDKLYEKDITIEIKGKTYKANVKESQEFIAKARTKVFPEDYFKQKDDFVKKLKEVEKEIRELQSSSKDPVGTLAKIAARKAEKDKISTESQKLDAKYPAEFQQIEDIKAIFSKRSEEIRVKEEKLDNLIARSNQNLSSINGYNPHTGNVSMQKLSFGTTGLYSYNLGPMIQLNAKYKFHESNRFSNDPTLNLSLAGGPGGMKLTEALGSDTDKGFGTEIGLSQTLDKNMKFSNNFHLGASYNFNPRFSITGGVDVPIKKGTFDNINDPNSLFNALNPYLGLTYSFK
jgi:hypothetical protein